MTTPNQPAPDGAYVIGGSGNSGGAAYGQEITDKGAAQLMLGGFTSIAAISNPLDAVGAAMSMFADQLMRLPLEVLRLFEPLIPGDLLGAFNTVTGAVNAIIGFFQGLGPLLTNTFNSFINTTYNVLNSIVNQIADIFNGLVVTPINSIIQGVFDWWNQITGQVSHNTNAVEDAQVAANVANIEVAIIKAQLAADGIGGAALSDRFDGPAAGSLNPALWSQTYGGPGAGYLGLDGSGNAQWFSSGGGDRSSVNFFLTPLDTDNEAVAILLGSVPTTTNAIWPEIHLLLRMDGAGNAVMCRIFNGGVQIGYLASGSYISLASPVAVAMSGQQSYQFKARTVGATHTFSILQDNIEVASLTSPTSGPTLYGAGYRHPGWTASAGTLQNFFVFFQEAPPVVRVFSAGDIL